VRFLFSTALKDLRRRRRDPVALIAWVATPVVMILLMHLVFGPRGGSAHGLLLVADEDGSIASGMLAGMFTQGRLAEMISVEKVGRESGRARLRKGDGSALLTIPKGFGLAVLRGEPARLHLLTNPAQSILPGIIEEALSIAVDGAFYLQSVAGERLRAMSAGPPRGSPTFPDLAVAMVSVTINRLVRRIQTYLNPPLIRLDTAVEEPTGPTLTFSGAFFPALLFLALLFMSQGLSGDIWREHAMGALRRVGATPASLGAFLAGKLLAGAILMAMLGIIALAGGRWLLHLTISKPAGALLWMIFSGAVFFLLMMLLHIHASNMRMGNILNSAVMFPLSMLGGCFFPFEALPQNLAAVGRWTPNGLAVLQFKSLLAGTVEPARLAITMAALAAFATLAFTLTLRRARRML
jgi:hypothetical protein